MILTKLFSASFFKKNENIVFNFNNNSKLVYTVQKLNLWEK